MENTQIANQLGGRAIGAIFFAVFGAIWLALAFHALELLSVVFISGVVLGTMVLLLTGMYLVHLANRWPRVPDDPAISRAFGWINAIQWVAVAAVAFSFAKLHIDAYVMSAITAIVGLHLLPFARLFRNRLHYGTGALLVAWALASALLVPIDHMQGIAALGTGAILWLSAAVTLAIALQSARESADPLAS
jgi:uncharacterized membrane protein YccF (DUF307 family)